MTQNSLLQIQGRNNSCMSFCNCIYKNLVLHYVCTITFPIVQLFQVGVGKKFPSTLGSTNKLSSYPNRLVLESYNY